MYPFPSLNCNWERCGKDEMDITTLFLKTLDDMELYLEATDPYDILMIAALLRKLFLDGSPLFDQVNKIYKIKHTFSIIDATEFVEKARKR